MSAWYAGRILALETSCDETSAAVVEGRRVLSNVVSSQAELHRQWGGIVPEAAARAHVEAILPVIEEALGQAGCPLDQIAAVVATNRPGLVGALSVGVTAAKAIAYAWRLPFVGVHHLEGHLLSPFALLEPPLPPGEGAGGEGIPPGMGRLPSQFASSEPTLPLGEGAGGEGIPPGVGRLPSQFAPSEPPLPSGEGAGGEGIPPHLCLIVSGGHTELVDVQAPGRYRVVAETIDDAAGEAFDKSARLLGLGYPGGAAIQLAAAEGDPRRFPLPRALPDDIGKFSFSGLKTAVLRLVEKEGKGLSVADAAASLQAAIVDSLTAKTMAWCERLDAPMLTLVGGVAANSALRASLAAQCRRLGVAFLPAAPSVCTDNAAMIGLAGSSLLARGVRDSLDLDCFPNAPLP